MGLLKFQIQNTNANASTGVLFFNGITRDRRGTLKLINRALALGRGMRVARKPTVKILPFQIAANSKIPITFDH